MVVQLSTVLFLNINVGVVRVVSVGVVRVVSVGVGVVDCGVFLFSLHFWFIFCMHFLHCHLFPPCLFPFDGNSSIGCIVLHFLHSLVSMVFPFLGLGAYLCTILLRLWWICTGRFFG